MPARLLRLCLFALILTEAVPVVADTPPLPPEPALKSYRAVFQVSDDDPRKWNLTLVNARNVQAELGKTNVTIEIVVYGPATNMLRIESEVAPGVGEAIENGIEVVACENTMIGLHITPMDMLPDLKYTRSGVSYLIKKQAQGYAYIRP